MSAARVTNSRHVRQRKVNTKQPLRIIREAQIDDAVDDESRRHILQVETGVEKGEEIEYHLQAVIHAASAAALGAKDAKQNYIPTPDVVKAKDVQYDELYPKTFKEPATYIRFSSTVEDSVGPQYCMNDNDLEFLARLNDGKDINGQPRKDKLSQCSEDIFEEVMTFFEETSSRVQPFAEVDNAPILSLDELERSVDENMSPEALKWLKLIYQYWILRKGARSLIPSVKVRVLDPSSEADDADPYVCFRRREVRQTRKTRGRDAQVVEKLKKLRIELEQARQLVQMVAQREQLYKENLEISRKVFEQRKQLKEVKVANNIVGEKGEDEELLVAIKQVKPKPKVESAQRPATIRIRSSGERAPENDLIQLADLQQEAEAQVQHTIESRKEQHRRWNQQWVDETWRPITPPLDAADRPPKWAPLMPLGASYPTPPPTLPSEDSRDQDEDIDMRDQQNTKVEGATLTPEPEFIFHIPGAFPADEDDAPLISIKRDPTPACRLRYGRGGRCHLEAKRRKLNNFYSRGVVSDSESDDDDDEIFFPVDRQKIFDYRSAIHNNRARPDGMTGERRHWHSGDQSVMTMHGGGGLQPQVAGHQQSGNSEKP